MIETSKLKKIFGPIRAVDGIDLKVEKGEVLGFLGPNGAGKSTTMKMLTGFLRPSGGKARVGGHDVVAHPLDVQRVIGYLPEGAPAYPDMTPVGFLKFVASVRGMSAAATKSAIERVEDLAQLRGVMRQPIETLSKGYKRRVGLAQALLHDPDILILDEPTDGLDPNQKHEVRELIRSMAGRKCVILSTHILEEVEAVCTRAVVIARGKLLADGTPGDLRSRAPGHNAVRIRVSGAIDGLMETLRSVQGVADVERLSGSEDAAGATMVCRVRPINGRQVAPEVGRVVRERGLTLDEFTVEQGKLDEVFRDITTTQARPADRTPAAASSDTSGSES
ncbi:MAG: ABC transporter ATP-binding protein [Phycisphaerae bacterium]|nr:ABC transporter ATP-binding protein [Phycisphaerae bacterium]